MTDNNNNMPSQEEAVRLANTEQTHLQKLRIRKEINTQAGDLPSLLGTTSDVASLCLLNDLISIVAEAQSGGDFAQYVQIKSTLLLELAPDQDVAEAAVEILDRIKNQETVFPVIQKGLANAFGEIEQRANAVTSVLSSFDGSEPTG